MGKRKKSSRKPQGPKKKEKLDTNFACLFCNHEHSVTVKLDKKAGTGELSCKICGQQFQTSTNYLSAAVDVYADWVDACDSVAKEGEEPARPYVASEAHSRPPRSIAKHTGGDEDEEDDDGPNSYAEAGDNFIDDADDAGHADYDDE